jgi:hypothetical protein
VSDELKSFSIPFDLTQEAADLRAELERVKAECERWKMAYGEAYQKIPAPNEMVILREDYERLIKSLPAGPRIVK